MSTTLPYMNSTGLISKILNKIIEAQTPPKYTQDFQSNKLTYGSGSAKPFIPLLKRIGFLNSEGIPTDLYKRFRNSSTRGSAMASAIKIGYAPLYSISEYAHELDNKKLRDAVIQVTGASSDANYVSSIVGTFNILKTFANFDENLSSNTENTIDSEKDKPEKLPTSTPHQTSVPQFTGFNRGMNLSYTINLNLPETKDPEVFDAIFTSLKEKLLN